MSALLGVLVATVGVVAIWYLWARKLRQKPGEQPPAQ